MAMADITIRRAYGANRVSKKPKGVTLRKITSQDGDKVTVYSIDANSPSFGEEFLYVFSRSVAKARRENKRLFGSPNGPKAG